MAYNNGFPVTYQQLQQPMYYQPQGQYPNNQVGNNQYVNPAYTNAQYSGSNQQYNNSQTQIGESNINWVQGEAGARSWSVAPGKSVLLMDSEGNTFYIKTADASGMPMPLRIFDFQERPTSGNNSHGQTEVVDTSQFVTKEDLDKKMDEILSLMAEKSVKNESSV